MDEQNQKEPFKVIIAGSREFTDYEFLKSKCDYYLSNKIKTHEVIIVSGHARGADVLGERYAREKGLKLLTFPADWDKYGNSAGYRRNCKMADIANACIGFTIKGLDCKGTRQMLKIANNKKLKIQEIEYDKEIQTEKSTGQLN